MQKFKMEKILKGMGVSVVEGHVLTKDVLAALGYNIFEKTFDSFESAAKWANKCWHLEIDPFVDSESGKQKSCREIEAKILALFQYQYDEWSDGGQIKQVFQNKSILNLQEIKKKLDKKQKDLYEMFKSDLLSNLNGIAWDDDECYCGLQKILSNKIQSDSTDVDIELSKVRKDRSSGEGYEYEMFVYML